MILKLKHLNDHHVVLEVDSELCTTIIAACELRGEWFGTSGDDKLGDRLDTITTVWMIGRKEGYITTRVAWLALAADACDWYARVLRPPRDDELARRAKTASQQLRSVIQEYRTMIGRKSKNKTSNIRWYRGP